MDDLAHRSHRASGQLDWLSGPPTESLPGILLLALITLIGMGFARILPFKSPVIVWICLFAMIATSPLFPGNAYTAAASGKINLLALATPILAYAGLSLNPPCVLGPRRFSAR